MEFLDLAPGASIELRVTGYQDGSTVIHPTTVTSRHIAIHMVQKNLVAPPPAGTPISVEIPVLRLFGERLDQPSPASYWDVSSKTLRADLLMRFLGAGGKEVTLRLTANGAAPRKRYSVEVL
jgi:hypothetical protein